MKLDFTSFDQAINSFQEAIAKTEEFSDSEDFTMLKCLKAGSIQNFEFTYELAWKFMKRWLENNLGNTYVDGVPRRELFRLARENKLISDVDVWMEYHSVRNMTSHTYNFHVAEEVYAIAKQFLNDVENFLEELKKRND